MYDVIWKSASSCDWYCIVAVRADASAIRIAACSRLALVVRRTISVAAMSSGLPEEDVVGLAPIGSGNVGPIFRL